MGRGGGRAMAWRRGWGGWYPPPAYAPPPGYAWAPPAAYGWGAVPPAGYTEVNERVAIEQQITALQKQLKMLQDRLEELGQQDKGEE